MAPTKRTSTAREPRRHEQCGPDLHGLAVIGASQKPGAKPRHRAVGSSPTMAPTSEMATATFSEVKR